MVEEREVAGLWCSEVLKKLSDFLDDDLEPKLRAQVIAHLAGCSVCDRFGGEMQRLIAAARALSDTPAPEREDRLVAALEAFDGD